MTKLIEITKQIFDKQVLRIFWGPALPSPGEVVTQKIAAKFELT